MSVKLFTMLLLGWLMVLILAHPIAAEEWTSWGGPRGDFIVESSAKLAESWPEDGPVLLWSRPLGSGYSGVLALEDNLYTMYRSGEEELEAQSEVVVALQAANGQTLWEHRTQTPLWEGMIESFGVGPNATPLLLGERLFAIGVSGHLRSLDAETGRLLWERDLARLYSRRVRDLEYGYSASPLAFEGKVLIQVGGRDHAIVALHPDDGSIAWGSEAGGVSYAQASIVELQGQHHFLYFEADGIVALDPSTGSTLWRHPIKRNTGIHLTPPVKTDNQHLWVGSQFATGGGRLLKVTLSDGRLVPEQVWFDRKLRTSHWPMIRQGDFIYGSIGGNEVSRLGAFDWRSGKIAWRIRGYHKAQALYADDKLLFLSEDGRLVLASITPEGPVILAEHPVAESVAWTVPTLVGSILYLRDQKTIQAFDLGP